VGIIPDRPETVLPPGFPLKIPVLLESANKTRTNFPLRPPHGSWGKRPENRDFIDGISGLSWQEGREGVAGDK